MNPQATRFLDIFAAGTAFVSLHPQPFTLTAADGFPLGATLYAPRWSAKAALVVAGDPTVSQGFYRRFAEFAANRGFEVLTFDYRGIGSSSPPTLRDFRMDLLDWGRLDFAAAVSCFAHRDLPVYVIGHSFAGAALGLIDCHAQVSGFYVFGAGTGSEGWMGSRERLRLRALNGLALPLLTRWNGYSPRKMLGMGEDLPTQACEQWRQWAKLPSGFLDDPGVHAGPSYFSQVRTRILAANALDDFWTPGLSRDALLAAYSQAQVEARDLDPVLLGSGIGHWGYFRHSAAPYWDEALKWFDGLARREGAEAQQGRSNRSPVTGTPTDV